jgi:hypothetical protein
MVQKAATIVDLTTDLATGRISANASTSLAGQLVRDAKGFPLYDMKYLSVKDPSDLGRLAEAFNLAALGETGYNACNDAKQTREK